MRDPDPAKPFSDNYLLCDGYQRVETYPFTDASGVLRFEKLRYERPDPHAPKGYEKKFTYRHRDGNGHWVMGIGDDDGERPLYHLESLRNADPGVPVYVCESGKVCNKLAKLGLLATCCAASWNTTDVEPLRGRKLRLLVDNDVNGTGEFNAENTLNVLKPVAASIRVVRGGPRGGNLADLLDDEITIEEFDALCGNVPEQQPEEGQAPPPPPLVYVDLSKWIDTPVPQREWSVLNRIPARNVTAYAGHGGTGKTITAMMLAAAQVLAPLKQKLNGPNRDWLGSVPEPGPVIYFSTEDDKDEMHRRFARIAEHYNASIADLLNGGLHLLDYVGKDAILGFVGRNGIIQPTTLLDQLHEAACDIKPKTFVIDSLADVFAGKENDRAQARQFVTLLRNMALTANTAIVLIGHPSLSGLNTGSGLSGSTDWHNAPRGRMYLEAATTQKGGEPDKDLRVLKVMKQNYGRPGEIVTVRWQSGVFVPEASPSSLEKLAREQKVDELFLKLLDRWSNQNRPVSDKRTANNYAPTCFADEPQAKADRISKQELAAAMARLFAADKLRCGTYGPPSRQHSMLVRKQQSEGGCS